MSTPDEEHLRALLILAVAGDNAAYAAFLGHVSGRLRSYFRRRASAFADDIEDLVQETMLAIHNQRHSYRIDQPVTAWLYAIARYKLIDALRARSKRSAVIDSSERGEDEAAAVASTEAPAHEARRDLWVLLQALPDHFRLPIVHVKIEGLSVSETAGLLGMSEPAVKIGIHRGMRALARRVQEGGP